MSRWTFRMECVDVTLGHNLECRGSMSRLPILVLQCSTGDHLKDKFVNLAFWQDKSRCKGLKFSWGILTPGHRFRGGDSLPRLCGPMRKSARTPCPGLEDARSCAATQRERNGDTLTCRPSAQRSLQVWKVLRSYTERVWLFCVSEEMAQTLLATFYRFPLDYSMWDRIFGVADRQIAPICMQCAGACAPPRMCLTPIT